MQIAGCNPVPMYLPGWDLEELLALNDIAANSLLLADLVRSHYTVPLKSSSQPIMCNNRPHRPCAAQKMQGIDSSTCREARITLGREHIFVTGVVHHVWLSSWLLS